MTAFELRLHQPSGTVIITAHDSEEQGERRSRTTSSDLFDSSQDTYEPNSIALSSFPAPQASSYFRCCIGYGFASPRGLTSSTYLILGSLIFALILHSFHAAAIPFRNVTTRHRVPLPPQCHQAFFCGFTDYYGFRTTILCFHISLTSCC